MCVLGVHVLFYTFCVHHGTCIGAYLGKALPYMYTDVVIIQSVGIMNLSGKPDTRLTT